MPTLHLPEAGKPGRATNTVVRAGWSALGTGFVVLGFIGAIVPLMPTTIFLILAAGCFARCSPRLERWLLDQPRFGPALRAWRAERAIPRRAKYAACGGMAIGYVIFLCGARPSWVLALVVAAMLAGCAIWMICQREPLSDPDAT